MATDPKCFPYWTARLFFPIFNSPSIEYKYVIVSEVVGTHNLVISKWEELPAHANRLMLYNGETEIILEEDFGTLAGI